jgi:hypothetical protein
MAPLGDQLVQDAVSLAEFVRSISGPCERRGGTFAHRTSSEKFFAYIEALADATQSYLSRRLQSTAKPRDLLQLRREIASLRISWRFLHQFVKPAIDADTLNLPDALVQGLSVRFREIPLFRETDFIFIHSDRFNYLNVTLAVFKRRADSISKCVSGPEFPPNLSIIGIPYSQSSSLFLNCLIPHEMGHYVFGELSLGIKFKGELESELLTRIDPGNPSNIGDIVELLAQWIEELFCDAFAVRLVGFCFSAAFAELFDLARLLDERGKYDTQKSRDGAEFAEYPPDLLRLRQQAMRLERDGWWNELKAIDSQYATSIVAAKELEDKDFVCPALFSEHSMDPVPVIQSFFKILPRVEIELEQATAGLTSSSRGWSAFSDGIASCLEHGVVPSSLRDEAGEPSDVVTLLNSAYRFYVQEMPKLMLHIAKADPASISDRMHWARRVELWTSKAIEDVLLLRRKRHPAA